MPRRRLVRFALRLVLGAVALVAAGCAAIAVRGLDDDVGPSDVGVVLGSKVEADGRPSARLQARLDEAADLYDRGVFRHVIVSGGTGVEGFSEARVMADYLAGRRRLPREALLLDEHGDTTDATARNAAALMKARGFASALVVTQWFHVARCRYALRRAGVEEVRSAHARYVEARDAYSTLRELVALPAYWLR